MAGQASWFIIHAAHYFFLPAPSVRQNGQRSFAACQCMPSGILRAAYHEHTCGSKRLSAFSGTNLPLVSTLLHSASRCDVHRCRVINIFFEATEPLRVPFVMPNVKMLCDLSKCCHAGPPIMIFILLLRVRGLQVFPVESNRNAPQGKLPGPDRESSNKTVIFT